MFIRKCSIQLIRDVSGITPSSVRMFQPLGQNQTFTVHARPMMHLLFETCAREELNKFKVYVHAAGGKRFKLEDQPSFFSLSGCSTTIHLLDHRHFHVLDVAVVGQIKVLGHGKTSSMIAGIMIVSLHRPKVLTKTVRKFTAGFSNVQHVTSLAKDRIDHAGGSTIEPPIEVNTPARGRYRISLRREVTGATPGSVAWKCSWWCLVLLREGGKGTMDQDVTEVSFSPMDAQGLALKYVRSGWVFSQNVEIRQEDFLNLVVTGMEIEHQGHFYRSLATVFAVTFAESSFPAYFLCSLPASSN